MNNEPKTDHALNISNENTENSAEKRPEPEESAEKAFDYTYVSATARIAQYDDLRSAPRITEIQPAETTAYIENLASRVYEQAKLAGGSIPYTVIREVSENFIHARFKEIIVSILDEGNTIRFADQGPGILNKEKAQLPGFSSAIEPMKHYIRGVGSGLPIVREYLGFSHGSITIEDNLGTGSVVTISMADKAPEQNSEAAGARVHRELGRYGQPDGRNENPAYGYAPFASGQNQAAYAYDARPPMNVEQRRAQARASRGQALAPHLTPREREFLPIFLSEGELGVTEISRLTDVPASSTHGILQKLEEAGLIEKVGRKRALTDLGYEVAQNL